MESNYERLIKVLMLLAISILCLQFTVFSNGAKSYESPADNGGIFFDGDSNISLVEETVTFSQFEEAFFPYSKVSVNYILKNSSDVDQKFDLFFIVPPLDSDKEKDSFKAYLDGKDISSYSSYEQANKIENWSPVFSLGEIEPYSKKVIAKYSSRINIRTYGIKIPVTIKANGCSYLDIEYICRGGYARLDDYENTIYSFLYYLTPASFWEGEPKIRLNVNFPSDEDYAFYSNIPMKETSSSRYSCELSKLPGHEWLFTYVSREGLIYGTNNSKIHTRITMAISLALFLLALHVYKKIKKRYIINLGYFFSVLYFFIFAGKLLDGNIGDAFVFLFLIIVFFIIVPILYFASLGLSKRSNSV